MRKLADDIGSGSRRGLAWRAQDSRTTSDIHIAVRILPGKVDVAAILPILPFHVLFLEQNARANNEGLFRKSLLDRRQLAGLHAIGQKWRLDERCWRGDFA